MTSTALPGAGAGAGAGANASNGNSWRPQLSGASHPWGVLFVGYVDRAGGSRFQLTLFPPGTTAEQRRALLFRRQWLPWGPIVWFLVAFGLATVMNGWTAIAIGGAVYVGVLLAANAHAGGARRGVVEVRAQLLSFMGHKEAFGDFELLESAATFLLRLDELAVERGIDPVEYEKRWGEVYRQIVDRRGLPSVRSRT